jgi:ribosomal protein S18 acetylase RimI-like enzyme
MAAEPSRAIPLDLADDVTAVSVLSVQRAAYAAEAELIEFDGIPGLHETLDELRRSEEHWIGIFEEGQLVAALAYEVTPEILDISRLVVSPAAARRGFGLQLVNTVLDTVSRPTTIVSTPSANIPALALYSKLGFRDVREEEVVPGLTVTYLQRIRGARPGQL